LSEYTHRFPQYADRLRLQVELHRALAEPAPDAADDPSSTAPAAAGSSASEPAGLAANGPDRCGPVSGDGQAMERREDFRTIRKLGHGGMGWSTRRTRKRWAATCP
jgi:hypothetical protein